MAQKGFIRFTDSKGTPTTREQIKLLRTLKVDDCDIPKTMQEACAMTEFLLNRMAPPHIPPSLEFLLFLRKNGIPKVPVTHDEAIRLAHNVTMAYELFAFIIAKYGLSWNPEDNHLIPAILQKCYRCYGQPFPDCWIDAVHWLATVANAEQRRIVPLCIAHVHHEACAVEKQAIELATDAGIAQCLQEEYDRIAQIQRDAKVAQRLSDSM